MMAVASLGTRKGQPVDLRRSFSLVRAGRPDWARGSVQLMARSTHARFCALQANEMRRCAHMTRLCLLPESL